MFVVFCPRHGTPVLLFVDNIESLVNHADGIDLHWRCTCGATGAKHLHRRPLYPALLEAC